MEKIKMFNYKIKTVMKFLLLAILPFQLAKSVGAITVEILDSQVAITQNKIQGYLSRKDSTVIGFSSVGNQDYEFSTVYTEILGKNFNDPNGDEETVGTGTSFFIARQQQHDVTYADYSPLNFQYQ